MPNPQARIAEMFDRSLPLNVGLLLLATLICAPPVPTAAEHGHLLASYRIFHPEFLANDWTFGAAWSRSIVFDVIVGAATTIAPLDVVGWLGRIATWTLVFTGLLRLGRQVGLSYPSMSVVALLWLVMGQSITGGERVFPLFAPNAVAWGLVFLSLEAMLAGKQLRGALLLGLTFAVHPAVGLSAAVGMGVALVAIRTPLGQLLRIGIAALLAALPGLLPVLPVAFGTARATLDDWRFQVLVRQPTHLDPFSFSVGQMLELLVVVAFSLIVWSKRPQDRAIRFMVAFEAGLGLVFAGGIAARWVGRFDLLKVFPFRLLPAVAPLLCLMLVAKLWRERDEYPITPGLAALALATLLALPSPWFGGLGQVWGARKAWLGPDDGGKALEWTATHTPPGAVVIASPDRWDVQYRSQRAAIANWHFTRHEDLREWRSRVEMLVGAVSRSMPSNAALADLFRQRTEEEIIAIRRRYGGDYLVSDGTYSFPVRFRSGRFSVYDLTALPPGPASP